jgi:hypothetical protein
MQEVWKGAIWREATIGTRVEITIYFNDLRAKRREATIGFI